MKLNYLLIPIITFLTAFVGGCFTSSGMEWYRTINLPAWTPPGSVIGMVWTVIFILSTIAALIVWNTSERNTVFWVIIAMFLCNALLNIGWCYIFFGKHLIGLAIIEAAVLDISVIILIILIWKSSVIASLLFFPYAVWVAFATYLTYTIWMLNR
ncbi:MAG: TspO/MBR family protein [Candidatus Ancaeobacter aquaticus]|nr:TspO/MBR family protein [Candidatus Ancaeobacter aquaticus]